tara:strand:- start:349 stop:1029 length:681 start_codon:yes stop_codon:yes gene_type:complete
MKIGKWFGKREAPVILEDDILVRDEWYQYYRKCSNNIKIMFRILHHPNLLKDTEFFKDSLADMKLLVDIKDPEELKEWELFCRTREKDIPNPKPRKGIQKKQSWNERRKELHSWLKRAKAVNIDPLPSSRPFLGQRKEWEESIVRAEKLSKIKKGKFAPGDGAYKWECIEILKSLRINDSLRIEDRVYQTVDWWIRYVHNRMKEFQDKKFIVKGIDHNTQVIRRVK